MLKTMLLVWMCFMSTMVCAEERYPFPTKRQSAQFYHLTQELRCMVCSHQNLAESNAPLAMDMKQEIYTRVMHGESDHDILIFLTDRYGDVILFNPPLKGMTWFLWAAPCIFILLGFWVYSRSTHRQKDNS